MLQGEAIGARAISDARSDPRAAGWGGAWRAGVRPGQGLRVTRGRADERPVADGGSKIR